MASRKRPKRHPSFFWNAFSYIFVGLWALWYWAQTALVAPAAAIVVVIFSIIEITGSILHLVPPELTRKLEQAVFHVAPWVEHDESWIQFGASILLVLAVGGLIYHHWSLDIQINRTNVVLSSMSTLLEDESMRQRGGEGGDRIRVILNGLVFAVLAHVAHRGKMFATVLMQKQPGDKFELPYQDDQGVFKSTIQLDPYESAAASLTKMKCGTLLYIPNAGFKHGIRIVREDITTNGAKTSIRKTYRAFEIVPNAFQELDDDNQEKVRSLLCVQVPLGSDNGRRGPHGEFAMICLSSDRHGGMRELEFTAIKHAAAFASFALKESESRYA